MSSKWTPQQRFNDSIAYLKTVSTELGNHVENRLRTDVDGAGKAISLEGSKWYAMFGSSNTGRAVRALLLCQRAYLSSNWSKKTGDVAADRNAVNGASLTKNMFLNKSESIVKQAIQLYVATTPSIGELASAAAILGNGVPGAKIDFEVVTRATNPFPSGLICFDCVYWWLFRAGFVSLRWILRNGIVLSAQNANILLGTGTLLQRGRDTVHDIPRGYIVYWRGNNMNDSYSICHWAVSLGDGYAIGSNNSTAGAGQRDSNGKFDVVRINFRSGGGAHGVFPMEEMWQLYEGDKAKSASTGLCGCEFGMIDPTTIPNRNTGF